jgi:hypothetical protein
LEGNGDFAVEIEIKLFVARRRIQLTVLAINKKDNQKVVGFSVPFKTTSSGGAMRYLSQLNTHILTFINTHSFIH